MIASASRHSRAQMTLSMIAGRSFFIWIGVVNVERCGKQLSFGKSRTSPVTSSRFVSAAARCRQCDARVSPSSAARSRVRRIPVCQPVAVVSIVISGKRIGWLTGFDDRRSGWRRQLRVDRHVGQWNSLGNSAVPGVGTQCNLHLTRPVRTTAEQFLNFQPVKAIAAATYPR